MITFVLGTRPEVVKLSPVINRFQPSERRVIWIGQHWSDSLIADIWGSSGYQGEMVCLDPPNNRQCTLDPTAPAHQLAFMLWGLTTNPDLWIPKPSWVVVQGDTTSALAGALTASKLGLRVFHVEAGCRSGDRDQPEELNRVLIDHAASGHACSYQCDDLNLCREGISYSLGAHPSQVIISGDTTAESMQAAMISRAEGEKTGAILATVHRAETLASKELLGGIIDFLADLALSREVTLFAHPHLQAVLRSHGLDPAARGVMVLESVPPPAFRASLARCGAVVTDSGGVTIEAGWLGTPCLIARDVTELRDIVDGGRAVVGGRTLESLREGWKKLPKEPPPLTKALERAWDGRASERIAEVLRG